MPNAMATMYRVYPTGQPEDATTFTATGRDEAMRLAATAIRELDPLGILAPSEYVVEEARCVATPPPDPTTWPPGWYCTGSDHRSDAGTVEIEEAPDGQHAVFVSTPAIYTRAQVEALCMAMAWALHGAGGGE